MGHLFLACQHFFPVSGVACGCSFLFHFLYFAIQIEKITLPLLPAGLHGHGSILFEAESGVAKIFLEKHAVILGIEILVFGGGGLRIADQSLVFGALTERGIFGA